MNEPIFSCSVLLSRHPAQKNEKVIQYRRGKGTPFIGSTSKFKAERDAMLGTLRRIKLNNLSAQFPIRGDIHAKFLFYFANFYTKAGARNQKIPDLSNLYHFPEDCLQEVGIIENDSFICSHDGSRRLPSPDQLNKLEILIYKIDSASV